MFRHKTQSMPRGLLAAIDYRHFQISHGTYRDNDPLPRARPATRRCRPASACLWFPWRAPAWSNGCGCTATQSFWQATICGWRSPSTARRDPRSPRPLRFLFPGLAEGQNYHNFLVLNKGGFLNVLPVPYGAGLSIAAINRGQKELKNVGVTISYEPLPSDRVANRLRLRGAFLDASAPSASGELLSFSGRGRWLGLVCQPPEGGTSAHRPRRRPAATRLGEHKLASTHRPRVRRGKNSLPERTIEIARLVFPSARADRLHKFDPPASGRRHYYRQPSGAVLCRVTHAPAKDRDHRAGLCRAAVGVRRVSPAPAESLPPDGAGQPCGAGKLPSADHRSGLVVHAERLRRGPTGRLWLSQSPRLRLRQSLDRTVDQHRQAPPVGRVLRTWLEQHLSGRAAIVSDRAAAARRDGRLLPHAGQDLRLGLAARTWPPRSIPSPKGTICSISASSARTTSPRCWRNWRR